MNLTESDDGLNYGLQVGAGLFRSLGNSEDLKGPSIWRIKGSEGYLLAAGQRATA